MKPFPATPELLSVAERVVWFKTPSEALADPVHFLAHVMTYGTVKTCVHSKDWLAPVSSGKRSNTRRPASSIRVPGRTGI